MSTCLFGKLSNITTSQHQIQWGIKKYCHWVQRKRKNSGPATIITANKEERREGKMLFLQLSSFSLHSHTNQSIFISSYV